MMSSRSAALTPPPLRGASRAGEAASPPTRAGALNRPRSTVPIPAASIVGGFDLLAALTAAVASVMLASGGIERVAVNAGLPHFLVAAGFLPLWALNFGLIGLYDQRRIATATSEAWRVLAACALGSLGVVGAAWLVAGGATAAHVAPLFFPVAAVLGLSVRMARRRAVVRPAADPRRVLIVGTGPRALAVHRELSTAAEYVPIGFIDPAPCATEATPGPTLGTLEDLEPVLMREAIDEVFITLPVKSHYGSIQRVIDSCERVGVRAKYQADIFSSRVAWPRWDGGDQPVVTLLVAPDDWRLAAKRAGDVVGAAIGLLLLSPVLLVVSLAILATSGRPVFYAQERYGLNRRRFRMLKFRTMVRDADRLQASLETRNQADGPVFKIADDPRITPLGRLLRRTSIDELPQLVNVLAGQMSLVGPRPLPVRDVTRITRPADLRRFSVRPGLTCLWQISGRCRLTFDEWIALDLRYIDSWSLRLDLWILLRTPRAVLQGDGAS